MAGIELASRNLEEDDGVVPVAVELAWLLARLPVALQQSGLWAKVRANVDDLRKAGVDVLGPFDRPLR